MSPKRKGKKRRSSTPAKKKESPDGFGTLAEQVKAARRDLRAERRETARQEEEAKAAERARREEEARRRGREPEPEDDRPKRSLTRDELMAEAFDALDGSFSGAEKYLGDGYKASDVLIVEDRDFPPDVEGDDAGSAGGLTRDDLLFAEAMAADVQRLESKKAALAERDWSGVKWQTQAEIESLTAADLERLSITPEQRDLLKRSRKTQMQVVHLRYLKKRDAMSDLEAFIRGCFGRSERFARVVHGKGRQSEGDPVIKPAVIAWCDGAGSMWVKAWAPEIDHTGRFGSVVIELRRR